MTEAIHRYVWTACALTLLALAGCRQAPEGWIPVLEETSTTFLRSATESIAAHVRSARSALPGDPHAASAELIKAESTLDHLLTYYLPLLDARERAYNAYRHHQLGRTAETERELDQIERILIEVAHDGGPLPRAMTEPLERLEDARAAIEAGTDDAAGALEALALRLNSLLVKGGLVLNS